MSRAALMEVVYNIAFPLRKGGCNGTVQNAILQKIFRKKSNSRVSVLDIDARIWYPIKVEKIKTEYRLV